MNLTIVGIPCSTLSRNLFLLWCGTGANREPKPAGEHQQSMLKNCTRRTKEVVRLQLQSNTRPFEISRQNNSNTPKPVRIPQGTGSKTYKRNRELLSKDSVKGTPEEIFGSKTLIGY
jgi:hypothetical protein